MVEDGSCREESQVLKRNDTNVKKKILENLFGNAIQLANSNAIQLF